MKGDIIIARNYCGRPLIRRVWSYDSDAVYITNEEQYELLKAGRKTLFPIGFPREDVFEYNAELAEKAEALYQSGKLDWGKLSEWKPK